MYVRSFFAKVLAGLALLAGLSFAWALGTTRFVGVEGERTYYLYSASSQAAQKKGLSPLDIGKVRGESVRVCGQTAEEIIELCEAEILFTEEVAGVRSYYCVTKKWSDGVRIGEYFVNLQVAERGEECVAGAPIIFGGF